MSGNIPPSSGSNDSTFGGISPTQQAQSDLADIQALTVQLQQALQNNDSVNQIQTLVEQIQKAMTDLNNIASSQPSPLSSAQTQLINSASDQLQQIEHKHEHASPSDIAMLQATTNTASQLLAAPVNANINVDALQATNQLSSLATALNENSKTPHSHAHHDLIGSMSEPASTLSAQMQAGNLTTDQTYLATTVLDTVSSLLNAPTSSPPSTQTVQQLQESVLQLNESCLE